MTPEQKYQDLAHWLGMTLQQYKVPVVDDPFELDEVSFVYNVATAFSAQLAEKDAEIERLGKEYDEWHLNQLEYFEIKRDNARITIKDLQQENQKLAALLQQASQQVEELKEYGACYEYSVDAAFTGRYEERWQDLSQRQRDKWLHSFEASFQEWKIKQPPTNHSNQGGETRWAILPSVRMSSAWLRMAVKDGLLRLTKYGSLIAALNPNRLLSAITTGLIIHLPLP